MFFCQSGTSLLCPHSASEDPITLKYAKNYLYLHWSRNPDDKIARDAAYQTLTETSCVGKCHCVCQLRHDQDVGVTAPVPYYRQNFMAKWDI